MDPSTTPTPSTQAGPALYEDKFWYFPDGAHTVFSSKAGKAQVYKGWLLIIDEISNQEVRRIPLNSQTDYKASLGMLRFKKIDGQKAGGLSYNQNLIYGYNPKLNLFSYWFALFAGKRIKALRAAMDQAKA